MKQSFAILDFGTSKITVLIGSRGINETVCVDGDGVCEYDGYRRGGWVNEDTLARSIGQAIDGAQTKARRRIQKLYVGVPNDFSDTIAINAGISLKRKRKVNGEDIENLKNSGIPKEGFEGWELINIQPIFYTLDNAHKLVDPEGLISTRLGGQFSYTYARQDFIAAVRAALNDCEIDDIEFVSTSLAELHYLFSDYARDRGVILADVGAIGTSLTIGQGDGILVQKFFDWGGDRINAALMKQFGLPFDQAEQLKKKAILTLDVNYTPSLFGDDVSDEHDPDVVDDGLVSEDEPRVNIVQKEYEIVVESDVKKFDVEDVNVAIKSELARFGSYFRSALKQYPPAFMKGVALSITGGGLCCIRGAVEFVSIHVNRETETVKPQQPIYDKPWLSAPLAMLDFVLRYGSNDVGLFDGIKRLFSKRK